MRLLIVAVGRLKVGPERELIERYLERSRAIGRTVGLSPIDTTEVPESAARRAADRIREEAKALIAATPKGARKIALDVHDRNLTSEKLAASLIAMRDQGAPTAAFYIGGADGLDQQIRREADLVLAFGAVTFPHQLVRVLLAEQIYRAITILSGHPYHRG
jgi:23S rRNA (pseudouridine1915-N3)-methyltransferase